MSYKAQEVYESPIAGEFPPINDATKLLAAFYEMQAHSIKVDGPVITAGPESDEPMRQVPLSAEHGIYFNHHPQTLTITKTTARKLEGLMADWFAHYPMEPSYARTQYNVPMLFTRFDGMIKPDGTIGVCEFDDVATGYNAMEDISPIMRSYVDAVTGQLQAPLHSAFLPENGYVYPHDDHRWLPSTNGSHQPDISVIPRARRVAPGYEKFMDTWGEQSVVGAWERDNKGPLLPMGLGAVAANLSIVLDMASVVRQTKAPPMFIKGWRSSRTEAAAVVAHDKLGIRGTSTPNQVAKKFEEDSPLIIQPFYQPPTMEELGLHFRPQDAATLEQFQANARASNAASQAKPGNEPKYNVLSRIYGVYLPNQKTHQIVGGFWMARPNAAIIHGASDAITGTLNVEGLEAYKAHD